MPVIKEFEHLRIPFGDIKSATNDFGNSNYIGRGGFGNVYKGTLIRSDQIQTMVAVKRLDPESSQGDLEFWKEILMLSYHTHENIVSLLGFCDESGEKIIVYEYVSNKSLDRHLNRTDLTWIQRLKICIGAARGLEYLHDPNGTQQRILHRDIKSSNILLDENWNAKISDFGLSKLGPANQEYTFAVTHKVGTPGYCDPLYLMTGMLTKESDVYSFGVVLFEVLCGRLCTDNSKDKRQYLVPLATQSFEKNKLNEIVYDPIKKEMNPDSLKAYATIAYKCLKKDREERPTMTQIVKELEIALESLLVAPSNYGMFLLGCEHYQRRCKIRAPCCNQIFSCHRCHNKDTSLLNDPNERHKMASKDVKQVVCMICDTEQHATQICANCGVKMGEYYCEICKMFDDDGSKQPFHCSDCGICRNGGRENTFHCQKCGCCYAAGKHDSDVCLENATKTNCSVCNEYLFDSYKEVIAVYCGHAFHKDCFPEMFSQHRCPICFKLSIPRQEPSKDILDEKNRDQIN